MRLASAPMLVAPCADAFVYLEMRRRRPVTRIVGLGRFRQASDELISALRNWTEVHGDIAIACDGTTELEQVTLVGEVKELGSLQLREVADTGIRKVRQRIDQLAEVEAEFQGSHCRRNSSRYTVVRGQSTSPAAAAARCRQLIRLNRLHPDADLQLAFDRIKDGGEVVHAWVAPLRQHPVQAL